MLSDELVNGGEGSLHPHADANIRVSSECSGLILSLAMYSMGYLLSIYYILDPGRSAMSETKSLESSRGDGQGAAHNI